MLHGSYLLCYGQPSHMESVDEWLECTIVHISVYLVGVDH